MLWSQESMRKSLGWTGQKLKRLEVARAAEIKLTALEQAADEGDLSRRSPVMELWEVRSRPPLRFSIRGRPQIDSEPLIFNPLPPSLAVALSLADGGPLFV